MPRAESRRQTAYLSDKERQMGMRSHGRRPSSESLRYKPRVRVPRDGAQEEGHTKVTPIPRKVAKAFRYYRIPADGPVNWTEIYAAQSE